MFSAVHFVNGLEIGSGVITVVGAHVPPQPWSVPPGAPIQILKKVPIWGCRIHNVQVLRITVHVRRMSALTLYNVRNKRI